MNSKKRIHLIIYCTVFAVIFGYIFYKRIARCSDAKYTVGIILSIEAAADGGPSAKYSYRVQNTDYEGESTLGLNDGRKIGDTCYVFFEASSPSNSEMCFDKKVPPFQFGKIPPGGWDSLPR